MFNRTVVRYQILCTTIKKPSRNISCATVIPLFPCTQNLMEYHCSCEHSLSFICKYTQGIVGTHFILTAVTQGHVNLILCILHWRQTMHYCLDLRCFHIISVLPLLTARNVLGFYWPAIPRIFWKISWNFGDIPW